MLIWDLDSPAWLSFLYGLLRLDAALLVGRGVHITKQPEKPTKAWYKKPSGIIGIIAGSIFLAPIVIGILMVALLSMADIEERVNPSTQQESMVQKQKAKYEINIAGNAYAGPAQRRITFTVTNIGDAPGSPSCTVIVDSGEATSKYYSGTDYVSWKTPLNPGERKYFEGLIRISDDGAAYATRVRVEC